MPLREETIVFEDELGRLEDKREALAEEVAAMDEGNPTLQQKAQQGQAIDAHLDGLEWAMEAHDDGDVPAWDDDVDAITLAGLTGGEYGGMENDLAEAAQGGENVVGAQRVYQVRAGTVDAPYLDDGMSDTEEIAAVASLPIGFLKWAEYRIDKLSSVGNGERTGFGELVAAKKAEK